IFTDKYPLSPVQNYRGQGAPLVIIDNNQVKTVLAQCFDLQVPLQKYNLFSRGSFKLNDAVSAFGQLNYLRYTARDETSPANATSPGKFLTIPANNPFISPDFATILDSRPNPAAPITYAKQLAELGNRVESYEYNVFQATFGFNGDVPGRDVTWELSSSQGKLATMPYGDLRFALGADYRADRFNYVPDSSMVVGDGFAYGSVLPSGGNTDVKEVFGELLIPVLGKMPLLQELSFDLGY